MNDENEDLGLCPTCGKNPASEPHACPYQWDVNGDHDEEYCMCCDDCQSNCSEEI